ncbi:hypothetical protein CNR22_17980 [Sphingobacteriaceae bacterium]|nr:hypothetical protein CNR22_17980 [Sphingobacteriaceae bacterium]
MVKFGFIVEGETEKVLLESHAFHQLISELGAEFIPEIINADGNGNLLPRNIEKHSQILKDKGATHILILTDLDKDLCVTETKNRIQPAQNHYCVVSKKVIESWFLSDIDALRTFVKSNIDGYLDPETIDNPFEEIRRVRFQRIGIGFNNKRKLAYSMLENGFPFKRAAAHPNCSSAKYFIDKLTLLAKQN